MTRLIVLQKNGSAKQVNMTHAPFVVLGRAEHRDRTVAHRVHRRADADGRRLRHARHATGMTKLSVGDRAPAFGLKDQNGKTVRLSQFKGKNVVVYFYPGVSALG